MLNQMILVGRLTSDPTITKLEDGKEISTINLAVNRSFKNANGEYETDFIPVSLYNTIANNTAEYCKKGDIVGIKGRIQTVNGNIELIAEKVTFLSSKKEESGGIS